MRPKRELALGLCAGVLLAVLIIGQGAEVAPGALDLRLSTHRTEPNGAKAWAQGVAALGHPVERWERPLLGLPTDRTGKLLVVLAPDRWLDYGEQAALSQWVKEGGDLLLAGDRLDIVLWCNGWRRDTMPAGGLEGRFTIGDRAYVIPQVRYRLGRVPDSLYVDSARAADLGPRFCRATRPRRLDTLMRAPSGTPLAIRASYKGAGTLTVVADGELFSNRALRETPAGEFTLSLIPPGTRTVIVDEYAHDYGSRGSLTGAILSWSLRDPLGWALWQVIVIAMLALLVGAARTGPIRRFFSPSRRTALEHVQALARTLGASRGHDVAIGLLVRGLRRRLSAPGRSVRDDPRGWLLRTRERTRVAAVRRAIDRLLGLTTPGQGAEEVLAAANAVEDVWQELRP